MKTKFEPMKACNQMEREAKRIATKALGMGVD